MSPLAKLLALLSTSVGRKIVVAVTGLALLAFTVVHLLGNLLVFQGRDALNSYAFWLKSTPLIWVARAGLLAVFAVHIALAIRLARENRAARPQRYLRAIATARSREESRYVVWTGMTILAFVIFHLLHFTVGVIEPEAHRLVDGQGRHDVYGMVVAGFSRPAIVATYVIAMLLLGVHLRHGALSALQTLGLGDPTWAPLARFGANAVVLGLVLGNVTIPILVLLGLEGSPEVAS